MRNAIPRRPHKERSQPLARGRHGLLEKHKDYSLRAKDHNLKKARLRLLRQKAVERNPDEFHFGMMSSTTRNGGIKVADRGNKALSDGVVKLLKTQDAGYLRTMASKSRKERERLEQEIMLCEKAGANGKVTELKALKDEKGSRKAKHTVFVEDEAAQNEFDAEEWFGTDEKGVGRAYNRPRKIEVAQDLPIVGSSAAAKKKTQREQEAEEKAWKAGQAVQKKRERDQERRRAVLDAVKTREKDLMTAEEELDRQRNKMNNNIGGVNKNGVKFKVRERKR